MPKIEERVGFKSLKAFNGALLAKQYMVIMEATHRNKKILHG